MRNAEIAAAMTELGDPVRARRRRPLPRDRLPGGGPGDPPEPGLGRRARARRARRPSCPGSATTLQEKIVALLETGEIPAAAKLKAKFPAIAGRGDADPGPRREDRAPALRRARGRQPRRAARGGRGRADPRRQGPRAEGRGERARGARRSSARRAPPERLLLSRGAAGRRGAGRGAARAPGLRRGRGRRLGAAAGRDLQGHRPDRDRDRPGGAGEGARPSTRSPPRRARPATRGPRIVTYNGISVDLRIVAPGRLRQPAPALHRLGRSTTSSCASGPCKQGLSVSEHGIAEIESGEVDALRRPRRRSTSASASPTSSPSCARATARSPRRRRASCPTWSSSATSAATCTATRRSRTGATRSRRWPRRRGRAATPTSRSPTTRPATASATTSPPTRCSSGSRRSRALQRGARRAASALLAGSEVNILPDGSLDYERRGARAARLGDRQRPHLVPDLARRR